MKIGILTFHFAHNNGAMLQTYGLSTFLRSLGYDAEIIDYRLRYIYRWKEHYSFYSYYMSQREDGFSVFKSLLRTFRYYKRAKYDYEDSWDSFESFMKNHLHKSKRVYSNHLRKLNYDLLICGSDQIWNTELTGGFDSAYFLEFTEGCRKIAYAASSGSSSLDVKHIERISDALKKFSYISCRESGLAATVATITGKETSVVCDPLFLLNRAQWEVLASESSLMIEEPYLLVYSFWEDEFFYERLAECAADLNLQIVKIGKPHKDYMPPVGFPPIRYIDAGPIEFLNLILNANHVFTNMFHGTATSIMFNRPISVLLPPVRQERLKELLDRTGLWSVAISEESERNYSGQVISYQKINEIIGQFRSYSIDFLKKAIEA